MEEQADLTREESFINRFVQVVISVDLATFLPLRIAILQITKVHGAAMPA
jgi:hypothetical protein